MRKGRENDVMREIFCRWGWGILGLLLLLAGCRREEPGVLRWRESIEQLNEGAQWGFCRAALYEAAATRAAVEQLPGAERLFRALACSERIQERHCIEAIDRLGGGYTPPYRPKLFIHATEHNLQTLLYTPHPYGLVEIERVAAEGNRYAERLMVRHVASCNRCLRAVEYYLRSGEPEAPHYAICPRCGYLTDDRYPDPCCPQCGESSRRFRRF